jgi:mitochondrial fission protein ELM1
MPASAYRAILMHDSPENTANFLRYELIPSTVSPEVVKNAAVDEGLFAGSKFTGPKVLGLVFGGDGEGCVWKEENYKLLLSSLILRSERNKQGFWVATSRRTPPNFESYAKNTATQSPFFAGGCWYHNREDSDASFFAMMGICDLLFVTADSMSMTHEAIASGRPVVSILPQAGKPNARLYSNLKQLESMGRLFCCSVDELSEFLPEPEPSGGWKLITEDPHRVTATAVLELMRESE